MQPPARSAAGTPSPRRLVIENVNRDHRSAGLGRCGERRMIGEPEIEAKPDDDGIFGQARDRSLARQTLRATANAAS